MQKLLATVLTGTMLFSLAACSGSNTPSSSGDSADGGKNLSISVILKPRLLSTGAMLLPVPKPTEPKIPM